MAHKSRVPPFIKHILNIDEEISKTFVLAVNKVLPLRSYRKYYKALEMSCHGIPWFAFWIAFTWLFPKTSYVQLQVNMLFGLAVDILLIAICKAFFRRRRPATNRDDVLGQIGPDVFSFPSGHASRAAFVAFFFYCLYPLHPIVVFPIFLWVIAICVSRVLMSRHHILDVVAGILLGMFEGLLMWMMWISDDTAKWFMSIVSDEKLDGGEYHV